MIDYNALLICMTAFATGFAVAWAIAGKTREQLAALQARADAQVQAAEDKLELVTEAKTTLANAFKALSAEALNASNQSFLQLAHATLEKFQATAQGELEARRQAVDSLVQPIAASLAKVDGKLAEIEKAREAAYSALNEQLRGLVETHLPRLHEETASLVKALRQPTVRGRWGELQLKRVVEIAGMLEHCDFVQQPSSDTDGGRLRPDLIVKLPGGRQVVIDAKAPITAYLEAAEAEDEAARAAHLRRHAELVRGHFTALGRKAYWEAFEQTPDFVIMFLPGEAFYYAAHQADPTLLEASANEKVLIATPTSLIGMLRTIAAGFREEALARNAEEVAALGRQLYERIASLAGHWKDVGDKLEKAIGAYNKSVGTLETRVLVSARRFAELKAAPEGVELEAPEPVDTQPRALQAPELAARDSGASVERIARVG